MARVRDADVVAVFLAGSASGDFDKFSISGFGKAESTASLPGLSLQQSMTRAAIPILTNEIDRAEIKQSATLAQFFYLRGCYFLSSGDIVAAFDDFESILKLDASSFPMQLILFAMYEMTSQELSQLPDGFFERNGVWRSLFEQASEKNEFLRKTQLLSDPMIEIGSLQEYLESIKSTELVDQRTFLNILKLLGITHDAAVADTLLQAIRSIEAADSGPSHAIGRTSCMQFVDVWRVLLQNKKQQIAHQLKINPEEEVIKVLPLVRIIDRGDGTLVLTSKNLLFAPNRSNIAIILTPLNKITDIKKFQFKKLLPPGYPALDITVSIDMIGTKGKKTEKVELSHTYSVLFFSERDDWFSYLKEMQNAHLAATKLGDANYISQAACNISLVEAVSRVCVGHASLPHPSAIFAAVAEQPAQHGAEVEADDAPVLALQPAGWLVFRCGLARTDADHEAADIPQRRAAEDTGLDCETHRRHVRCQCCANACR